MGLFVDIEKKVGDFTLKVKFNTDTQVYAILGASGCGKSLTLKCIAGIETPDRGRIILDDKVFFDSEKKINMPIGKRNVGYLFQDYALFPNMTVLENIMCAVNDKEIAMDLVKRFYLEGKENLYPQQLSGGQKQRAAMARMLGRKPDIIMLDEPFSALDNYLKSQLEREILNVIEDYNKIVLFVSHDRNEVYKLTDTIAVMEEGKIVDVQEKRELFSKPRTLAATLLTGCKNISKVDCVNGMFYATDWEVCLGKCMNQEKNPVYAGFRAHYFEYCTSMEDIGVIECEIIRVIEDTFSMIVLFKNSNRRIIENDYVMTWEMPKEKWQSIKDDKIFARIPYEKVILMER